MKKSNIKKYQNGGKNKLTQAELDLYNKYKAYVGSDIYLNRLKNFRTPQEAELEQYISLDRLKRAGIPVVSPVVLPNQIQGWYENPSVINGIGNIILSPRRDKYTYTHEMEHLNRSGGDRYNNAELSLLRGMNRSNSKLSKDQLDYLQDPRESGAKLSNLRSAAVELGIHQEFGEEFTEEQLQNLLEKVKEDKSFEFIQAYNPEELLQALNTIAYNPDTGEIYTAQNGGHIKKYQNSGSAEYPYQNFDFLNVFKKTKIRPNTLPFLEKSGITPEEVQSRIFLEEAFNNPDYRNRIFNSAPKKLSKKEKEEFVDFEIERRRRNLRNVVNFGDTLVSTEANGMYNPYSHSVSYDKAANNNQSVNVHELAHGIFLGNQLLPPDIAKIRNKVMSYEDALKFYSGDKNMQDALKNRKLQQYDNLASPPEVMSRIYQLREAASRFKITKPGENLTPDKFDDLLNKIYSGKDNELIDAADQLFMYIKGDDKNSSGDNLLYLLNSLTSADTKNDLIAMAQNGGNPQNNTMKNNKTYRGINKYQGGGSTEYDPAQYMSGLDTQFTDFMSQNPVFANVGQKPKVLSEREWRKQNGYPNVFMPWQGSREREAIEGYRAYVQGQKQSHESNLEALKIAQPMGKALFGLQKLNETADLERTFGQKRDAYSLDDEVPQMAYRGFFQQGGAIREEVEDTEEENNNEEMIDGIIEMLRQIEDMDNRKRVAIQKLQELQKEGIQVDAEDFLEDVMEEEYEEEQDVENMKNGGIPQRYKNLGFTRVGQKKNSTREGKKWMVLAKKGDKYKVVHGGAAGMSDYTKHGDKERRERFWKRHNAGAPGKSRDPFSPLYWHKKFGTWEQGGSVKLEGLNKYQNSGGVSIVKPGFLATLGNVSPATPSMINEYDKSLNFLKDWYSKRSHVDAAAAKQGFDNLSGDRNLFKIDGGLRDTSLGTYYPTLDLIGINRKAQMLNEFGGDGNTITHELAHRSHLKYSGSYPYLNLENFPYTVNESTPITDNIISGLSGKLIYDDNKSRREYLQDPHEIHARMMEFRQAYNLNPNSKFTKEQFNKLKSKGIDKDFTGQLINAFKSEDDFIQAMNDIVSSENDNTTIGMAQNGGMMGQGIMNQQMMGYKDNSPYKNLPFQDFFTNRLTMNGVSRPILALPDKGQPRVMLPNSGIYSFPLANQVREIPLAQNGLYTSEPQDSNQPTYEEYVYNLSPKQKEEYATELLSYMQEVGEEKMKKLAPKEYSFLVNYMAEQEQGDPRKKPDYDIEAPVLPEIEKTGERIYPEDYLTIRDAVDNNSRLNLKFTPSEEYEYRRKVEEINNRILDAMSKTPPRSTIQSTSLNEGLRQILNQGITNPKVPYAKNGFFSRLGRGIGKVARGVGNAFHDWGMMVADSAGNRLGLYDIDNERYKTRFGRGLAGVNDQLQSVTGKIGKAVASAAVPGMSGVFNMPGNIGAAINQQPMQQPAFNQYQQPQGGNYNQMQMLMNFLPYLSNSFQGSPMFNQGGRINLTGMYNPYSQLPNDYYMQGGTVKSGLITDSDAHNKKKGPGVSYPKRGPMGPKGYNYSTGRREVQDYTTFNEYIPTENLIPIQTEKDELIVLPTGDISPVMATKRHSRMREDEVTDVTPEGSYILSAHGDVRIYKDEANSVITEMGIKPYRLGYGQEKPTEKTLADFMHKNKMTPAEIGAKVMKQFPIWKTNNIFEASANDQNKINRRPYLEGLIQLSELDRYRKGLVQPEQMRNGGSVFRKDIMSYQRGGGTRGTGGTPWGEIAGIGGAFVQGLFSMAAANQQRREANRAYRDITNLVNQSTGTQANLMGMGAGMGIAGTLAQDPTVDWAQLDPSYIRQMEYRTPMGIRESMANRAYANRPDYMRFAPNFASGVSAEQAAYAQALKQGYDSEISLFDKDRAARNQYLSAIQGYQDKNEASRIAALNAMRLNRNQMIGNVGDRGQGLFDSRAILEANRAQSLAGARLGQLAAQQQAIKSQNQALNNIIGSATLGAQSYLNNRTNPTQGLYSESKCIDNEEYVKGISGWVPTGNKC